MDQHARGQARGIARLYLDFDSFFASAEQHFNPNLRGIDALIATLPKAYSVKKLREQLQLTHEAFAVIYGVDLCTRSER